MANNAWMDVRCEVCGRLIGKINGKEVHVKHKGREVKCKAPCVIVCDKEGCKHENMLRQKKEQT